MNVPTPTITGCLMHCGNCGITTAHPMLMPLGTLPMQLFGEGHFKKIGAVYQNKYPDHAT